MNKKERNLESDGGGGGGIGLAVRIGNLVFLFVFTWNPGGHEHSEIKKYV
jgi:hypothetical protein